MFLIHIKPHLAPPPKKKTYKRSVDGDCQVGHCRRLASDPHQEAIQHPGDMEEDILIQNSLWETMDTQSGFSWLNGQRICFPLLVSHLMRIGQLSLVKKIKACDLKMWIHESRHYTRANVIKRIESVFFFKYQNPFNFSFLCSRWFLDTGTAAWMALVQFRTGRPEHISVASCLNWYFDRSDMMTMGHETLSESLKKIR